MKYSQGEDGREFGEPVGPQQELPLEPGLVDAALVVDGNADEIIDRFTASGWLLAEHVDLVAGKRIRYLKRQEEDNE